MFFFFAKGRHNFFSSVVAIASEPFYNQLRTQEQLGYIVTSGVRRAHGTQGIKFLIQSDRHPQYVDERIEDFIKQFSVSMSKQLQFR